MRALQRLWRGSSPLSQRWNAAIAASTRPSTLATALRGLGGTRGIAQCPSIKAVKSAGSGGKATVRGWIRTFRAQKAWNFIEINDGSTFNSLQVVVPSELKSAGLGTGAAVEIEGELVPHPKHEGEVELHATSVKVIGECDSDYPLQKKRHTLEFLRDISHLRGRSNTIGAVLRMRDTLSFACRSYFHDNGFIEVNTPLITSNDCEGAGELFQVDTLNRTEPVGDNEELFFSRPAYLTVSGQLHAEVFALSHSKVYTLGPTFRAENSNTSRHLAEFWMLEPEMAYATMTDAMDAAEGCIKAALGAALKHRMEDLEFFAKRIDKEAVQRIAVASEEPFERITYTQAVQLLSETNTKFERRVSWGDDLGTEHERFLAEQVFKKPVFVTNYPADIKAFYMRRDDRPEPYTPSTAPSGWSPVASDKPTVSAFDLLVPRVGELVGGSAREERFSVLRDTMQRKGLVTVAVDGTVSGDLAWYLDLRRFGGVPHAGWGLGFERLVLFATGLDNIRDAIPFPRAPGQCAL